MKRVRIKLNEQNLKVYFGEGRDVRVLEVVYLDDYLDHIHDVP